MQEVIKKILQPADTKIALFVLDGLGGLTKEGKTELEAANTVYEIKGPELVDAVRVVCMGVRV